MGSVNRQAVGPRLQPFWLHKHVIGAKPVSVFTLAAVPPGEVMMCGHYHATGGTSCKSLNCHDANAGRVQLRHKRPNYSVDIENMYMPDQTFSFLALYIPPSPVQRQASASPLQEIVVKPRKKGF